LIEHTHPDLTNVPAQRHRATYDAYAAALLLLSLGHVFVANDDISRSDALRIALTMAGAA
jgi:DNA polymerase III epsilon subunit-like protein